MAVRLKTYLGSVLLLILAVGSVSGEYLGCYEDKKGRSRLMPDHVTYFNDINTPRRCTYLCTRLGYRYAGVEDGHLCFCSELEPSVNKKLIEAECSTPCPGDNKEFCGGPLRLSVYSGNVNPPSNAVYMGCYEDTGTRLLADNRFELHEINTPKKCINLCKSFGFPYAGIEVGVQCFCSKQRPSDDQKKPDAECNYFCPYTKHKCGGIWRLTVFTYPVDKATLLDISVYMGCYEDTERRLLADARFELPEINSPKKCISICKSLGLPYAGLEVGIQCFCSKRRPDEDTKKSDSDCNEFCPQTKHKCGGKWRLSVYTYPVDKESQLDISDDTVERTYLGCFEDNIKRILQEYKIDLNEINNPKKCIYICKQLGYDYAGVQNGNECLCGNERPATDLKRSENDCSVSCPFREQKCGGAWRIGVYSIEYP